MKWIFLYFKERGIIQGAFAGFRALALLYPPIVFVKWLKKIFGCYDQPPWSSSIKQLSSFSFSFSFFSFLVLVLFSLDSAPSNFSSVLDSVLEAAFVRFETSHIVTVLQTLFSWCLLALTCKLDLVEHPQFGPLHIYPLAISVLFFLGPSEAQGLSFCILIIFGALSLPTYIWSFCRSTLWTLLRCRYCPFKSLVWLSSLLCLLLWGDLRSFLLLSFLLLEYFDKTFI